MLVQKNKRLKTDNWFIGIVSTPTFLEREIERERDPKLFSV
jgi:hypothetical protein